MEVRAPFGFVTSCYGKDMLMVQAVLASIKHYCPDIPICLIVDGDVDVSELESEYGVWPLRISEMESAEKRELIQRSTRTKLAAMWEGPFEHFVWMDSDAILWGDITPLVSTDVDFQIFWDEISIPADAEEVPEWLAHYYFDMEKLSELDADFEWRGRAYFCDGVYACKRNAISYSEWEKVVRWGEQENRPWPKGFNCMPMMNYLVHSLADKGELSVGMADLQHIPVHHGHEEPDRDMEDCRWRFPKSIERPKVNHFCGRKPNVFDPDAYSKPFTIARLEHYRRNHGSLGAWRKVLSEDARIRAGKAWGRVKRWMGK